MQVYMLYTWSTSRCRPDVLHDMQSSLPVQSAGLSPLEWCTPVVGMYVDSKAVQQHVSAASGILKAPQRQVLAGEAVQL